MTAKHIIRNLTYTVVLRGNEAKQELDDANTVRENGLKLYVQAVYLGGDKEDRTLDCQSSALPS